MARKEARMLVATVAPARLARAQGVAAARRGEATSTGCVNYAASTGEWLLIYAAWIRLAPSVVM